MERDRDDTEQEFMKEVADDFGYVPRNERDQGLRQVDLRSGSGLLITVGVGVGVFLLIVIGLFLFTGDEEQVSREDIAALRTNLDRIGKDLSRLDGIEKRLVNLEKEQKRLRQSVNKLLRASTTKKKRKKASSQTKRRYHTVRAGESLYTIARKYGISTDKLCRLNKITPKKPIKPGQKLVVGP